MASWDIPEQAMEVSLPCLIVKLAIGRPVKKKWDI